MYAVVLSMKTLQQPVCLASETDHVEYFSERHTNMHPIVDPKIERKESGFHPGTITKNVIINPQTSTIKLDTEDHLIILIVQTWIVEWF